MTNTEFKNALEAADALIKEAQEARRELVNAFCAQAPFQPGDKVLIKYKTRERGRDMETEGVFFIRRANAPYFFALSDPEKAEYKYDFAKMKKDGTPSQNETYVGNIISIEKITP